MNLLFVCVEKFHYEQVVKELRKKHHVDFVFLSSKWLIKSGDYHVPKVFGRHLGFRFFEIILVHYLILKNNYNFCVTDYECTFVPLIPLISNRYLQLQ